MIPPLVLAGIIAACIYAAVYGATALGVHLLWTRKQPVAPRHALRKPWSATAICDFILCVAITIVILYIIGAW